MEDQVNELERLERVVDSSFKSGQGNQQKVTQVAQLEAAEAVKAVGVAMESDEAADEAVRFRIMAERTGERDKIRLARSKARAAAKQSKRDHKAATKVARKAYNTIRYSNPRGYGFLWVIMFLLGMNVLFSIMLLTVHVKGSYEFGFERMLDLINVPVDGVLLYLIWKRRRVARVVVMALCTFNIVAGTVFNIVTGNFDPLMQIGLSLFDLFMLTYFATSARVRLTLVNEVDSRRLADELDEEESFFRPKSWEFWRNLIIYYVIFSIVGHWMEAGVCLLIKYGIVPGTYDPTSQIWSDWLYPFPVYGIGFCACAVLLYPIKNWLQRKTGRTSVALVLSFIVNALVCTIIEFAMGMAVNADLQLWDYSNMFCNFMGQVCLQNALFFGLVATLMTWVVYPVLEKLFRRLSNETMTAVFAVVLVGFFLLMALYYVNFSVDDVVGAALGSSSTTASQPAG